jgi:CBS domain-containing protein
VEAVAFLDVRMVLGRDMVRIGDVMTREVETIDPSASLEEAASRMKTLDVGMLPVCDAERIVGMITDRDITIRATANGQVPAMTEVREAMTADVIYCEIGDDVRRAAGLMEAHQVRRLPVLDERSQAGRGGLPRRPGGANGQRRAFRRSPGRRLRAWRGPAPRRVVLRRIPTPTTQRKEKADAK